MRRFSQTLRVLLALFVAVFANGTLTSITAYAAEPTGTDQTETVVEPESSSTLEKTPTDTQDTTPNPQPLVQSFEEQTVLESALKEPTIGECSATTSELVNTKAGFASYDDQRATGHTSFQADGLHIWTEGATSTDKVAWYHAVSYSLSAVGTPSMNYSSTFGLQPGLQLVMDFNNDGTADGILVGETVYGDNWWLSNSAAQFAKDGAPHNGGGNGSQWYGTLNEWLAAFPNAKVTAVGFSLGSGVHADGILKSLTFGCHTWNFGLKPVTATPPVIAADPCGTQNDLFTIPETEGVVYWVNNQIVTAGTHSTNGKGSVTVTATAAEGYSLTGKTSWTLRFSTRPCIPVTPHAPDFYDFCGATKSDRVVIPFVRGVIYKIDGEVVRAGTYPVTSSSVTVTAEAADGFVIREGADSTWTYEFTNSNCISITKTSEPVTDTNGDGSIGVGDTVTWNITVTNNSPNKYENFRVQLDDATATLENDGLIEHLGAGKSVSLTATSTLTAEDVSVCKATNTVGFTAWYTHKHHKLNKEGRDESFFSERDSEPSEENNDNEYDTEDPISDLSGSTSAEAVFTCPTPGSGSGSTTTTSEETPETLPSTGPSDASSPLMILVAAAAAYGATYFLQRRRELATN